MPEFDSLTDLEKYLQNMVRYSLFSAGKDMRKVLIDNIYSEWYRRSGYKSFGDSSSHYTRTWQLPRAVDSQIEKDGSLNIWINDDLLTPVKTEGYNTFNSYMSLDGSVSYGDKSIGEWVTEWIEHGNSWPWMQGTDLHRKTEAELGEKNIAQRELIKALKTRDIDATEF